MSTVHSESRCRDEQIESLIRVAVLCSTSGHRLHDLEALHVTAGRCLASGIPATSIEQRFRRHLRAVAASTTTPSRGSFPVRLGEGTQRPLADGGAVLTLARTISGRALAVARRRS